MNKANWLTSSVTASAMLASAVLPLALTAAPAAAATAPAGCTGKTETGVWLNVVAEGVKSSEGLLAITVYEDKRSRFLAKGGSIYVGRIKARQGETRGCVFLPKTGIYAIALYHDEDADHNFDRNLLPEEGYGFSNNPSTLAGLPRFSSVRLNVPKTNLTTRIQMKYP
jgi:uncharacterized protein (DUF2141 family)